MITFEEATARIEKLDAAGVRSLVERRLSGADSAPVGSGYDFEPPEDLVIQLFRNPDLPPEMRKAVISGCKDVLGAILQKLAVTGDPDLEQETQDTVVRVCRLIDVAEPPELEGPTNALVELALDQPDIPTEVLAAAVRASMAYGQSFEDIPRWKHVLTKKEVAAYAVNALVAIDPRLPEIRTALIDLWKKQILENWPVDTPFLMRRALRHLDSEHARTLLVASVLQSLRSEPSVWSNVKEVLEKRSWSREWLRGAPEFSIFLPDTIDRMIINRHADRYQDVLDRLRIQFADENTCAVIDLATGSVFISKSIFQKEKIYNRFSDSPTFAIEHIHELKAVGYGFSNVMFNVMSEKKARALGSELWHEENLSVY